jgi:integrase
MPRVFHQQDTRPIPEGAERTTVKDKKTGEDKPAVRFKGPDGKWVVAPLTKNGDSCRMKSPNWYGWVDGKPVPLCANKAAAESLLGEKLKKAAQKLAGIADPYEEHRKRPLVEHLADFRKELEGRNNDPRYVALVHSRLTALCEGCSFRLLGELSASRVVDWLAQQRRDERAPALPADKVEFTRDEATAALGLTATAFRDAVKRLGLPATGKGPARRYPLATVCAVGDRTGRGRSVQTTNYYLSHLKSFCRWLAKDRRIAESPVAHLEANNVEVDRRHDRRELSDDELCRLLETARSSKRTLRGLTGEDRFHLYATACGTGYRAGGLASRRPAHFDLDAEPPPVTLSARRNKSRVRKVQPLPPDLAALLRNYLADRPADQPVWGGGWPGKGEGAEMLRADLADAGIPYVVEGPDGPLHADFHSLRHSYITALGRSGVDLRTAQELAPARPGGQRGEGAQFSSARPAPARGAGPPGDRHRGRGAGISSLPGDRRLQVTYKRR